MLLGASQCAGAPGQSKPYRTNLQILRAGSSATSEEVKEIPQGVATYYNPAYRPALAEELSSTDVKHAALSSRC